MQLPHNLTLLPGVRQLHNGRKYILGRYPSGKVVMVPYAEVGAPPGRTIPVPEPKPPATKSLPTYTAPDGTRRPVLHIPRRLHVVEGAGGNSAIPNEAWGAAEQSLLQPLVRLNGSKVAEILQQAPCWYHVQYHIDEEVK